MTISKGILLILLFTIFSCSDDNTKDIIKNTNYSKLEIADTLKGEVVYHTNFTLSYAEEYEQAYWVAYELLSSELVPNYERTDKFIKDPKVSTETANGDDYVGSGYDRGHLMPAAVCVWDSIAMYESFYYSNISPQNPSFNRGVWSRLEDIERDLAMKYDTIWVVITPIFNSIIETIGENNVAVPSEYGRAFLVKDNGIYKGVAFRLSNEGKPSDYDIIANSSITIDELEQLTGFDLFFQLNDSDELIIESTKSLEIFEGL